MALVVAVLIFTWIAWGLQLGGIGTPDGEKWKPTPGEIAGIVLVNVFLVVIFIIGLALQPILASLSAVYKAGGNGFECKSADEIKGDNSDA